jgi:hypothetical protein
MPVKSLISRFKTIPILIKNLAAKDLAKNDPALLSLNVMGLNRLKEPYFTTAVASDLVWLPKSMT